MIVGSATNTPGEDEDAYLDDNIIIGVNFPIFCIYLGLILFVAKKVGIQYVKKPMNYYLAGYLLVMTERALDGILIRFLIERNSWKQSGTYVVERTLYWVMINLHTVMDRLTIFVMMHFTLQMREVKIKLSSESVEEY